MLRKALSVVLAGLWLFFSAVDIIEDLDFSEEIKVHATQKSTSAGFGRTAKVAFNLVEHGSRRIVAADAIVVIPISVMSLVSDDAQRKQRRPKSCAVSINKLHSVFLI